MDAKVHSYTLLIKQNEDDKAHMVMHFNSILNIYLRQVGSKSYSDKICIMICNVYKIA